MHVHLPKEPVHNARRELIRQFGFAAVVGFLLLLNITGIWKTIAGVDTAVMLALVAGYRTFQSAISSLLEKRISADLAIAIAVIAALFAGEYVAAAEAMLIMLIGEGLEGYAAGRTHSAIKRLIDQMPHRATVVRDGHEVELDAAAVVPGDILLVRAGERIAADGTVVQGFSSVDESTITGEAVPRDKQNGDEVYSGTLNGHGLLRVEVTRAGRDTTLARVIRLIEEARRKRSPVERLADRYARYFLPALLLAASLTFYFTRDWTRTVAVLIVACPCALILATPAAMVAAIGGLARRGILVRGGAVLQNAARVDAVALDKTGTVTEGRLSIIKVVTAPGYSEDRLLALAAAAESGSEHVLSRVIVGEARRRRLAIGQAADLQIVPGRGITCTLSGVTIRAGNDAFLKESGVAGTEAFVADADRHGATAVLVAEQDHVAGAILFRDRLREGIVEAVHELGHLHIHHVVMLTGDRRRAAEAVAHEAGIHDIEAGLLPQDKLDRIRHLAGHGHVVAMVGDGINDAPALAAAHVGVAVSGAADVTAEAADAVVMSHSLERLPELFAVSRRAVATAWQNMIVFAGVVNFIAVAAAASGKLGPIGAAVTHQVASLLVMLNSLRLLREKRSSALTILPGLSDERLRRWRQELRHALHALDPRAGLERLIVRRKALARPVVLIAMCVIFLNGFYALGPDETAVVERLGKVVRPYPGPGLHYKLPWPLDRLTRIQARRVRLVEIGFRSVAGANTIEPAAYEWNVQHRSGRFQRKPEESLMLSGDQNMIEVNATVHYELDRPDQFLLRQFDGETTVRAAAESVLHSAVTSTPLDSILTEGRRTIEARILAKLQQRAARYGAGVRILAFKLLDVHPSLEVVDAFRDVAGALEEKDRKINEAQGYRNEQVALARGTAEARLRAAAGYSVSRVQRAEGDAGRFELFEHSFAAAPAVNQTRLYLETMEQILAGRRKVIVDSSKARRHLLMLDNGVEFAPAAAPLSSP